MRHSLLAIGSLISAVGMTQETQRQPGQTGTLHINGIDIPVDPRRDTAADVAKRAASLGLRVDALADGDLTFNYQTQPVVIELKRANGDRFTFSAPTHVATRALLAESDAILRRSVGRVATV